MYLIFSYKSPQMKNWKRNFRKGVCCLFILFITEDLVMKHGLFQTDSMNVFYFIGFEFLKFLRNDRPNANYLISDKYNLARK